MTYQAPSPDYDFETLGALAEQIAMALYASEKAKNRLDALIRHWDETGDRERYTDLLQLRKEFIS